MNRKENEGNWRCIERNGQKFMVFDFGENIVRVDLGVMEEERENKVIDFYMRRYEEYEVERKEEERR